MCLAGPAAFAEQRFALVVGANAGWSNDRPLRHAESDAERVRDVLVELGGFAPDRVELLRDPDSADVRSKLRRLSNTVRSLGEDSLVFIYYSGHSDETYLHLRGVPLTLEELHQALRELPATVKIGVLDSCRSGSILSAKGGTPTQRFAVKVEEPVRGLALLTSSGADELSQETKALAGSVFTHHLVSGLRGAADGDQDGKVTLSESYRYAYERTQTDTAASAVPQRPAFAFELRGQGDVVLTRIVQSTARLMLPRGEDRRYLVVDPQEWHLVAEGRAEPGREVGLALAPGDYQVKRVLPDQIESAAVSLAPGGVLRADALAWISRPLSAGVLKGRPDASEPAELREYKRGEALKLLAADEPGAALAIFDEVLKGKPDDWPSRRGRARALVRMAEAYEKVGDHPNERTALRDALTSDTSLSEDPDFKSWYQRLTELEAQDKRNEEIKKNVEKELSDNPRLKKRWGIGIDFISTRGIMVLVGSYKVIDTLYLYGSVDLIGPGVDAGLRWVPFGWKISPFIGGGVHTSLSGVGILPQRQSSVFTVNENAFDYVDIWGPGGHFDIGIQYFGGLGFSSEVGLGVILFNHPKFNTLETMPMVILNLGWYF
ncbi:MAG: caspase family protein [Myxococcaceae bacterium]